MTTFIVYQTDNKLGMTRVKELEAANHKHAMTSYLTSYNRQEKVMQVAASIHATFENAGKPIFVVYEKARGVDKAQYYVTR